MLSQIERVYGLIEHLYVNLDSKKGTHMEEALGVGDYKSIRGYLPIMSMEISPKYVSHRNSCKLSIRIRIMIVE